MLVLALLLPASALAELEISDARIIDLPPPVPVRAGYMEIRNPSPLAVGIDAIRSDALASVEIHHSVMQDGMVRMDPVDKLRIAPGASLQLAPGGLHLMMLADERIRAGDEVEIILLLGDGSEQPLKMKVIK
ncbi:MAG TPA: copper chaperone PCu(A)C [Gammaproteobacteria bacterium]|nr:copper chaperone PCu(A)C [Gammaproteobacteria bacterium]